MNHISFLPKFFHIDFPEELSKELLKCKNNNEVEKVGLEWGIEQSKELMIKKVPCIHYYTMSNSPSVKTIANEVFSLYFFLLFSNFFLANRLHWKNNCRGTI